MAKIKIDCSDSSVVLVCESCSGTWRAFAWTREDGHNRAVEHEKRAHPGTDDAMQARSLWRRRTLRAALVAAPATRR